MKVMSVKEAKGKGFVLPYDPHTNSGYIIILNGGGVHRDYNGHPIVYRTHASAIERVAEWRDRV